MWDKSSDRLQTVRHYGRFFTLTTREGERERRGGNFEIGHTVDLGPGGGMHRTRFSLRSSKAIMIERRTEEETTENDKEIKVRAANIGVDKREREAIER